MGETCCMIWATRVVHARHEPSPGERAHPQVVKALLACHLCLLLQNSAVDLVYARCSLSHLIHSM